MLLNPGTVLSGRYEILEKIGSGGMAVVYRGRDRKLDRYVTVKVLREEFVGDEEFIERFRSEACSVARLSHPNIVRAYDVGEDGDIKYIVNEYIHGDTLKKAIKEKAPFDSRSTINVAIQIASALSQAHKAHIVHRDIKPQNNMLWTGGNGTGLSYCLKYADDSTDENPVVLAKGVDENGKEFEQRIYINDVNPSSATVVEMRALEAHYKVEKQGGFTSLPLEAGNMGLNDRRDFIAMFKKSIEDLNKLGRFDLSLLWTKSMDTYLNLPNANSKYK